MGRGGGPVCTMGDRLLFPAGYLLSPGPVLRRKCWRETAGVISTPVPLPSSMPLQLWGTEPTRPVPPRTRSWKSNEVGGFTYKDPCSMGHRDRCWRDVARCHQLASDKRYGADPLLPQHQTGESTEDRAG